MKLKFLGTAASEGIPNPFCNCELCTKARHEGGKDVRTRASALIDGVIQIDLSPEWSAQWSAGYSRGPAGRRQCR